VDLLRFAPDGSPQPSFPPPEKVAATGRVPTGRRRRMLVVSTAAVFSIMAAVAWWRSERAEAPKYLTVSPEKGSVIRSVNATGTVNPVLTVIVGSYVSGVIRDVYCDYNTQVRKGQLCAKIDPRSYEAARDQAEGQLARDSAQLEMARLDLARYGALIEQDSIAKQTYDDQRALVHQLEGTVQLDRALVRTAEVNLGYTDILSPVNGTVVARNITLGQTVAASFQTPTLFLIATDLTKMQVDTNVSESDIGAVVQGNQVQFSVETFPHRTFNGAVNEVRQAPQTVQNVVTYDVVVGVDNSDFALKPGMTASVWITTEARSNVLRIPDRALRFNPDRGVDAHSGAQSGNQSRIWVLRNGAATPVPVTLGLDDDTNVEIVSGDLSLSDQVIVGEITNGSDSTGAASPGYLRTGR
jgi:HlyD family secretion protein